MTEEKVVNAAKAIAAEGKMPTIASVRIFMGERGSESTIHHYLTEWKKALLKRMIKIQL